MRFFPGIQVCSFFNSKNLIYIFLKKNLLTNYKVLVFTACCFVVNNTQAQVQAGFSNFDYSGCVPVKIQFTDSSSGSPASWLWDFGNGLISTSANPAVTYTVPGTYTVKMVVKNAVSADSVSKTIVISGAKADFNYSYTDICNKPATVKFAAVNPQSKVNYHWDFGDNNKSISQNPSNTYDTIGLFKVHLNTISPEGCEDSIVKTIQIGGGTADFAAPATACVNDYITFSDTSTPHALSATWKVNNVVIQQTTGDASFHFTRPGVYTVNLTESFGSCQSVAEKQIEVFSKPAASFTLGGILKSCTFPSIIQFTNTSSPGAVAFKWYFGDGDSSMEVSPAHTYQAGQFTPVLVAFNANGCSDTLQKKDSLFFGGPIINIINLPDSGCIPFTVTPLGSLAAPEAVASYAWDFGDGFTSAVALPQHIYTTTGRYNVSLTVQTISGCSTQTIISEAVAVGTPSIPDFTTDKTTVCGSSAVQFNATAGGPVSYWNWNFDNEGSSTLQNPVYSFLKTGSRTISLSVSNSGCVSKVKKTDYLFIQPPVSSYKVEYFCDDRLKVQFDDASMGPQTWLWDFGDGNTSAAQNPMHRYAESGKYLVRLTTTNGSCSSTYEKYIYLLNTKPAFSYVPADGFICRKGDIEIAVSNPSYISDYLWDFGDGSTLFSDTSVHYFYKKTGVYYPSLIAKYTNGCQDTLYSPDAITVTGPTANFRIAPATACLYDAVTFTDNSTSDGVHAIISRLWNYGDGITGGKDSLQVKHNYNASGTFKTSIAIADDHNCFDTVYTNLTVNALPAIDAGIDSFVCEGSSILLQPSGATSYLWNADPDLSCLSCASPSAAPLQSATYYVTGTDGNQCRATDSVFIEVVHPFTMSIDESSKDICFSHGVQLSAAGADLYTWSPPDGLSNTVTGNPVASPAATTTYTVTGTDRRYCFNVTGSVTVNVHPNPDVTIADTLLIAEKGTRNLITTTGSANIVKWYWYPSLGLSCTNCAQPVAEAIKNITYTAVVYADYGCTDTATVTIHVLCNQSKIFIPTAFTPNGDGRNDRFYVISSIDNPIRSFAVYNRAGEMIFNQNESVTNYSGDGWDGMFKGQPASSGTYIYRIEVVCNDAVVPFVGTVTLIR